MRGGRHKASKCWDESGGDCQPMTKGVAVGAIQTTIAGTDGKLEGVLHSCPVLQVCCLEENLASFTGSQQSRSMATTTPLAFMTQRLAKLTSANTDSGNANVSKATKTKRSDLRMNSGVEGVAVTFNTTQDAIKFLRFVGKSWYCRRILPPSTFIFIPTLAVGMRWFCTFNSRDKRRGFVFVA